MADDISTPEVLQAPQSLTQEAIQTGVDGIKGWLRQRAFHLKETEKGPPTVQIPRFRLKMAEAVYSDIFEARRIPLLYEDFDTIAVPDLVEDFVDNIRSSAAVKVFDEILTYLGFRNLEQREIKRFSSRDRTIILESGFVLWAIESEMNEGHPLQGISDESLEEVLEEKFRLTETVLPRCENRFGRAKKQRLHEIKAAIYYVEDFKKRYRVDRVENGIGVVPAREMFQSDEKFRVYLEELRGSKHSPHLQDLAPVAICELIGKKQHWPHGALDAFDHTLKVATELEVDRFGPKLAEYLRVASFLHDIGKAIDSKNPNHPYYSDYLADPILEEIGYDPQEREIIRILIRNHDWVRSLEVGEAGEREIVFDLTPPLDSPYSLEDFIEAGYELARADITSMPWALRGSAIRRGGLTQGEALSNLEKRHQSIRNICAELERECREMDRQTLPPLEAVEATFDTVVYQALRGMVGAEVELPRSNEDLIGFMVDALAEQEPQLVLASTYANRVKNVASCLSNYAEGYSDRVHQFVASFSLEIADALLALEQRELGNDPKVFLRKREVLTARRLLRQEWREVVETHLHGSSTFTFGEFLKEDGLLPSAEIDAQMRLTGELGLGVLPGEESTARETTPVRRYVYLTSNPAVARAYARLNTAGEGYNLHPLYKAEKASEQTNDILAQIQTLERRASGIGEDLPVEALKRYRAMNAAGKAIAGLAEDARSLAVKLSPLEFVLTQLRYIATQEPHVQRELLTARSLSYGFSRELPVDLDNVPTVSAWLDEVRIWGKAESQYLSTVYVDSGLVDGYERRLREVGREDIRVIPIQSLDIYASIKTSGRYDDKVEEVYHHLRWRPFTKLGQKVE